jgi:hypothetical protein
VEHALQGLALNELCAAGVLIQAEDVERPSPLVYHHIHLDGQYGSPTLVWGGLIA